MNATDRPMNATDRLLEAHRHHVLEKLTPSEDMQNRAIARHYLRVFTLARDLQAMIHLRDQIPPDGSLKKSDEMIEALASQIREAHLADFGLPLEWVDRSEAPEFEQAWLGEFVRSEPEAIKKRFLEAGWRVASRSLNLMFGDEMVAPGSPPNSKEKDLTIIRIGDLERLPEPQREEEIQRLLKPKN